MLNQFLSEKFFLNDQKFFKFHFEFEEYELIYGLFSARSKSYARFDNYETYSSTERSYTSEPNRGYVPNNSPSKSQNRRDYSQTSTASIHNRETVSTRQKNQNQYLVQPHLSQNLNDQQRSQNIQNSDKPKYAQNRESYGLIAQHNEDTTSASSWSSYVEPTNGPYRDNVHFSNYTGKVDDSNYNQNYNRQNLETTTRSFFTFLTQNTNGNQESNGNQEQNINQEQNRNQESNRNQDQNGTHSGYDYMANDKNKINSSNRQNEQIFSNQRNPQYYSQNNHQQGFSNAPTQSKNDDQISSGISESANQHVPDENPVRHPDQKYQIDIKYPSFNFGNDEREFYFYILG